MFSCSGLLSSAACVYQDVKLIEDKININSKAQASRIASEFSSGCHLEVWKAFFKKTFLYLVSYDKWRVLIQNP